MLPGRAQITETGGRPIALAAAALFQHNLDFKEFFLISPVL